MWVFSFMMSERSCIKLTQYIIFFFTMGIRSFLVVVVGLITLAFGSDWYPDFNKGVDKARKEGKLVMVYFYEEGCTYCKYMEEVVRSAHRPL